MKVNLDENRDKEIYCPMKFRNKKTGEIHDLYKPGCSACYRKALDIGCGNIDRNGNGECYEDTIEKKLKYICGGKG
jgi:hypothetical protein